MRNLPLEEYEKVRRELVEANANLHGLVLREPEIRLDEILSRLKGECREKGGMRYDIPPLTDENLWKSRLYGFCSRLPKGADLHVHDMALLPAGELIPLLVTCPEFCINADRRSFDLITVSPGEPVPVGYLRFSDAVQNGFYSEKELIENWTLSGTEGAAVWERFEGLFDKQAVLSGYSSFTGKYYDRAFRYCCEHGIMHVEIHIMLTDSLDDTASYLKTVRQAYYNVKKKYPYFTVRIIGAGVKADSENLELSKKCFLNTIYAQEIIKDEFDPEHPTDFIIGYDLVNEEDSSLPLHDFVPMLLKVKKQFPDIKLYIHGGESLAMDNENLIDAYLLGASRVGHGFNLYRYPDLHKKYIDAEICLEICPVSNQILGYARDIRNHPAIEYLRTGMPIALCSDDPAYMENESLTDDFFSAVMGWNLGIGDLKQLGINSILYSGLQDAVKYSSLKAYNELWNEFVEKELKNREEDSYEEIR